MVKHPTIHTEKIEELLLYETWDTFTVDTPVTEATCFVGPSSRTWEYDSFTLEEIERDDIIGIMVIPRTKSPRKAGYIFNISNFMKDESVVQKALDQNTANTEETENGESEPRHSPCLLCRYQTHNLGFVSIKNKVDRTHHNSSIIQPHCERCLQKLEHNIKSELEDTRKIFVKSLDW